MHFIVKDVENCKLFFNTHTKKRSSNPQKILNQFKRTITEFPENIKDLKTGLIYDDRTEKHQPFSHRHGVKAHVENPLRTMNIIKRFKENNLIDENVDYVSQVEPINSKLVKDLHGEYYYEVVESFWPEGLEKPQMKFKDTYYNQHSFDAARLSAESVRICTEKVVNGEWKNAFALSRPPGHHAQKDDRMSGFCFFNNVAISSKYAINDLGVKKVLILDWDVHHGDSTQKLLYDDPNILYMSIHRFDEGVFFPGPLGDVNNLGEGDGTGFNLNLPFNVNSNSEEIVEDSFYLHAFQRLILPVIKSFNPELVFISCGLDCLFGDPLGKIHLCGDSLIFMLEEIQKQVTSKVVVALEGGYNLENIPFTAEGLFRCLKGESFVNKGSPSQMYSMNYYKQSYCIIDYLYDQVEEVAKVWGKHWPIVLEQELIDQFKKFKFNTDDKLAGGHESNILLKGNNFYKKMNTFHCMNEFLMYSCINKNFPSLSKYTIPCHGIINGTMEDVLQNKEVTKITMQDIQNGIPNFKDFIKLTSLKTEQKPEFLSSLCKKFPSTTSKFKLSEIKEKCSSYLLHLENIMPDESYSVFDFKLKLNNYNNFYKLIDPKIRHPIYENDLILKVDGVLMKNSQCRPIYKSGDRMMGLTFPYQKKFIQLFFTSKGKIDFESIESCYAQMKELKNLIVDVEFNIEHSSVLVLYSKVHKNVIVKLIDFSYMPNKSFSCEDYGGIQLYENALEEIIESSKVH